MIIFFYMIEKEHLLNFSNFQHTWTTCPTSWPRPYLCPDILFFGGCCFILEVGRIQSRGKRDREDTQLNTPKIRKRSLLQYSYARQHLRAQKASEAWRITGNWPKFADPRRSYWATATCQALFCIKAQDLKIPALTDLTL